MKRRMEVVPENPSCIPGSRVQQQKQWRVVSGEWRVLRLGSVALLVTRHSPLLLVFLRHRPGNIDHCQDHKNKGLKKTGKNGQRHDRKRQN